MLRRMSRKVKRSASAESDAAKKTYVIRRGEVQLFKMEQKMKNRFSQLGSYGMATLSENLSTLVPRGWDYRTVVTMR
jgi:hypothetical protein